MNDPSNWDVCTYMHIFVSSFRCGSKDFCERIACAIAHPLAGTVHVNNSAPSARGHGSSVTDSLLSV